MTFRTYVPQSSLASAVELFWFDERAAHPRLTVERMLPTGAAGFIISFHDEAIQLFEGSKTDPPQRFGDTIVCGPRSKFFSIDMTTSVSLLGVQFRPGGIFPFFKFPAHELFNSRVSLDSLWGNDAAILREQLLAAPTIDDKFHVLEREMLKKAFRPLDSHPAVAYAMQEFKNGAKTISAITDQIGFSQQWFSRIFQEEVGLSPKLYYRVQRFQHVLELIASGRDIDWASIALTCGYFDQAHFIHDFQTFAGINPTAYVSDLTAQRIVSPSDTD